MTTTFGTNSNNDIYLGTNGNIVVLTSLAAVMAACATAAKAQLGEMIYATTSGIPNFQTIWIGTPNYAIFESYLRTTLENVEGVTQVNNLTMSTSNNILSYSATIMTIYGKDTLNGNQPV